MLFRRLLMKTTLYRKKKIKKLISWLDKENRPSDSTLKGWKHIVYNSKVKLNESDTYPLSTFSQKVVCNYYKTCPFNEKLKYIEVNLGIQPNHYNHLFDVAVQHETTSNYYSALEIDSLLKGKHTKIINEFREVLRAPILQWDIHRNKEDFREHVLNQVRYLAKKGYGAMAYAEAYGGIEDTEAYAYIFENMMYAGGSLSIKIWCAIWSFWRKHSKTRN